MSGEYYAKKFVEAIKKLSVNPDNWREEWQPNAMAIHEEGYCICTKEIQYHQGLSNVKNGKQCFIGCDCFETHFENIMPCKRCSTPMGNKTVRRRTKNYLCSSCTRYDRKMRAKYIYFGKYKGFTIGSILENDLSYCKWLCTQEWFEGQVKDFLQDYFEYSSKEYIPAKVI